MELRPYQFEAKKAIFNEWQKGNNKTLLVLPTGERVIIVMGAVNVMKPRVSGTLNKYILCIA